MSTLIAAFYNVKLISAIYIAILIFIFILGLIILLPKQRHELITLGIIDHGGLLGMAAIFAMPFISPFNVNYSDIFIGIFIEIFCAIIFLLSGLQIIKFLRTRAKIISQQRIYLLLLFKAVFFIMNYIGSGGQYGVFASDSRIDFLQISPILARTMYIDMMIDFIVLLNIGLQFATTKRIGLSKLGIILILIFLNFLSGSKGAMLLLIIYVALFTYAALPRSISSIPKKVIISLVSIFGIIVAIYIYALSKTHDMSVSDQIDVILYRFLLSADARIMAFDPNITRYILSQYHGDLLSELFRGPAKILGASVAEFPIGVYQFQEELNTTNYVGATNQLSAMFVIYRDYYWFVAFSVVAIVMFSAYQLFSRTLKSNNAGVAWVSAAALYYLSSTLVLGFDAFVQLLPISVATVFIIWTITSLKLKH